jgi:hypothetical protein
LMMWCRHVTADCGRRIYRGTGSRRGRHRLS